MRKDVKQGKYIIIVIAVTGECNLHCGFCAYDCIKKHKKMSYTTLNQLFDEIDNYPEEQNFLICWSGGEPTFDIDHLLTCQKVFLDRHYRKDKFIQAMITNCWWANNEDVVNKIKSMHLDVLGISASEYHIKEVPASNLTKIYDIFNNDETTVWAYFNGKCFDLYPELHEKVIPENTWAHTIRHPNWSILDCLKNLRHVEPNTVHIVKTCCGFYIHPDGTIGSCCTEEGNKPCMIGNVSKKGSLKNAIERLKKANLTNVTIKNCILPEESDLGNHMCRFCREAGFNVSCFSDNQGPIEIDFNDLVKNVSK